MKKQTILLMLTLLMISSSFTQAQDDNVIELPTAINNTGIAVAGADASALLDVISTDRGVLIPRMRQLQRDAILSPAQGLLIFQTDGNTGFYYYDGNNWTQLGGGSVAAGDRIEDADGDTRVHTEESPDEDLIRFDIAGTERMRLESDVLRMNAEMYFNAGFLGNPGDKIALNGNTIDGTSMTGLGYEVSPYTNLDGTISQFDDLYSRAEGAHRWYTNVLADGGLGASSMVLDRDGNLGIGTHTPETPLDVAGVMRSSSTVPELELYDTAAAENRIEASLRENGNIIYLESYWGDLRFRSGDAGTPSTRMTVDGPTGNIGIGTTTPVEKLHIINGTDVTGTGGGLIQLGNSSDLNMGIDENEIQARNNGATSTLMMQRAGGNLLLCGLENGSVGIGVSSSANIPVGYLLAVDGNVIAEEVRVELSGSWPDYVFQDDYQLPTVEELKESIEKNGHLPGVPSAKEIENDGLHLGDMQKRMMEKIEELTLYVIQLSEENQAIKAELSSLKNQSK